MPEKQARTKRVAARPKRNLTPFIFLGVSGALLIAVALILLPKPAPAAPTPVPGTPFAPRVTLEDAKQALEAGTAIFLDVRAAESYQAEHIRGAISIPEAEIPTRFGELDKNVWIITYCT